MTGPQRRLADDDARQAAITGHDRSLLVEAGAGTGKTAVLAGRIVLLLSEGTAPKSIAAVTFTEFAASELHVRVRKFVGALADGDIPIPLRVALPDGISENQRCNLAAASESLDEITSTTIHGFCRRLITPYPVEADIDPGAVVMDRDHSDLAFRELTDSWLREELAGEADGLLAELVLRDPSATVDLIHTVLDHCRRYRANTHDVVEDPAALTITFKEAVDAFNAFTGCAGIEEPETTVIAGQFRQLADAVESSLPVETPAALISLLLASPHTELCTQKGDFRKYQKKGKWQRAARQTGLSGADGDLLNDLANNLYGRCCETWTAVSQAVASRVLADLIPLVRPVLERFRDYKRAAGLLDFDDLILAARNLLHRHDEIRKALGARFSHILVDEFQDTDPVQAEIFWRLCGDPPTEGDTCDWTSFVLRPGALFLVGDPKQAIYRFRGADIAAYDRAHEAFHAQEPQDVVSIATNFRSDAGIVRFVNERFADRLSVEQGQPGFEALAPYQSDRAEGPSVVALDISVADAGGKASVPQQRAREARTVAAMCARLIGDEPIHDPRTKEKRLCRAGDIALLAPTGTELWRYEEALEELGISVATQAGKGFYRRQEIQDLIAVTRVLADPRDTLALGALLRGPLVGLTEETLLDIVWALPRGEDDVDKLPRLDIGVVPEMIVDPYARDIVEKLQTLRQRVNATTPHELLSQAIDVLHVRPMLLRRYRGQAERALANVDLYLSFSRVYAVRGLRAFAEAMTTAWSDKVRAVEGRPDAQEDAVALYTMHAAKGLEWPVVVLINAMTSVRTVDTAVTDRGSGRFFTPVMRVPPNGYDLARRAESDELARERVRLWYVATTRAHNLLVLPRLDVEASRFTWQSLVDLGLPSLPALDIGHLPAEVGVENKGVENQQTRKVFAGEAVAIAERQRRIVWQAPSRDEGAVGSVFQEEAWGILVSDGDGAPADDAERAMIQGGRERGVILHKLIEEVLTSETVDTPPSLAARAEILIRTLGHPVADDPALGLAPTELAGCVVRALSLPEVAELRPRLIPEVPVYASTLRDTREAVTAGIADAVAFGPNGVPHTVIDWKSDVDPTPKSLARYRSQVCTYLQVTGAERGLVVAVTPGIVMSVCQSEA